MINYTAKQKFLQLILRVVQNFRKNFFRFLHKIKNGSIDKSYGIHVASLANMPESLIARANEILDHYEQNATKPKTNNVQLALDFDPKPQEDEDIFDDIDPLNLTPIEALNVLYELKQKYSKKP